MDAGDEGGDDGDVGEDDDLRVKPEQADALPVQDDCGKERDGA